MLLSNCNRMIDEMYFGKILYVGTIGEMSRNILKYRIQILLFFKFFFPPPFLKKKNLTTFISIDPLNFFGMKQKYNLYLHITPYHRYYIVYIHILIMISKYNI